ncbi:hypothetical protein CR513_20704, partial [Mucuna pruriens]
MIDAASRGALMDKTLAVARHLISNMASNTQHFGIRGASQPRMLNEISVVDNLRLENQLTELTSLVRKLAIGQHQPIITTKVYGICTFVEHPTDMCPTLQETELDYLQSVEEIAIQEAIISATTELRAICGSMIPSYLECTSRSSQLSTTDFAIPGTTVPAIATTESASSRQLTISGRPYEAISNKQLGVPTNHEFQKYAVPAKYECQHSRPQDANMIVSKHCEPFIVDKIRQPTLTNNFEFEGNASIVTLRSGRELPQITSQ